MDKLYPPYLEGTIPAFYGDSLTVPFSMNKAIAESEIAGFSLKIKTIQNVFIGTLTSTEYDVNESLTVKFNIEPSLLNIGQSYKLQLAYIDDRGQTGYYSTVGVVKYTSKPSVTIAGLDSLAINGQLRDYIGVFRNQPEDGSAIYDPTEKVSSYRFIVYDTDMKVYEESEELTHNNTTNEPNQSSDVWRASKELVQNKNYYIRYIVTTINGMVVNSPLYRLMDRASIDPDAKISIITTLNYENGYIDVQLLGALSATNTEEPASGKFVISRKKIKDYEKWERIYNFVLQTELPSSVHWKDFTIEQGETYIYSIQQYNDSGLYSNRIFSNPVYADFEDAFLYDGERQLKIKYNPKVSNFKNDILESKMDTIGSKYPFIFRNGSVNYKEISLGGLISYWSDDEELFMPLEDLGLDDIDELSRFTTLGQHTVEVNKTQYHVDMNFDREITEAAYTVINVLKEKVDLGTATKSEAQLFEELTNLVDSVNNQHVITLEIDSGAYPDITVLNSYRNYRKKVVEDLLAKHIKTTDLESYNYTAERIFKLNVLEWLTNGKPKLFKSPSEGNYIVRLMNTSLAPTDTVNRLLHSFTTTAYEIADFNYNNLNDYGLITITEPSNKKLRFQTVDLFDENYYKHYRYSPSKEEDKNLYVPILGWGDLPEDYNNNNGKYYYWEEGEIYSNLSIEQQTILKSENRVFNGKPREDGGHFYPNAFYLKQTDNLGNETYILSKEKEKAKVIDGDAFRLLDPPLTEETFINDFYYIKIENEEGKPEYIKASKYEEGQEYWEKYTKYSEEDKYQYYVYEQNYVEILPNGRVAQFIQITNMIPGDMFYINGNYKEPYYIGITGSYNLMGLIPITSIRIRPNFDTRGNVIRMQGQLTYGYYSEYQNLFNLIEDIEIKDRISEQYIGENWDEIDGNTVNRNIISSLQDCKKETEYYYNIRFEKRPVQNLYLKTTEFFKLASPQPTEQNFDKDEYFIKNDKPIMYNVPYIKIEPFSRANPQPTRDNFNERTYYVQTPDGYVVEERYDLHHIYYISNYDPSQVYYTAYHLPSPLNIVKVAPMLYRDMRLTEPVVVLGEEESDESIMLKIGKSLQEWPMYRICLPPDHEEIPEESKWAHDREYYYIDRQQDKYCQFLHSYLAYNSALTKKAPAGEKIFEFIEEKNYSTKLYYNLNMDTPLKDYDPDFKTFDGQAKYTCVDLEDKIEAFDFDKIPKINDIYLMSGVMALVSYQICNKTYNLESIDENVKALKNRWERMDNYWRNLDSSVDLVELGITDFDEQFGKKKFYKNDSGEIISWEKFLVEYRENYKKYEEALDKAIEDYKQAEELNA